MIKAVVFDADDTLIDFKASMWSALRAVQREVSDLGLSVESLHEDWLTVRQTAAGTLAAVRREAFRYSLARAGVDDPAAVSRVAEIYTTQRRAATTAYPDVAPMLSALAGVYRLGYATNGTTAPEQVGIGEAFAFTLFAHADGVPPKPSPLFYDRVIELAGLEPGEIAFVGDDWTNDVCAPAEAGMHPIWLNRDAIPTPDAAVPEIATLTDLPAALSKVDPGVSCSFDGVSPS